MDGTFNVVDPRLAAGRGDEFSASRLREQQEAASLEEGWHLPMNQRIEDQLDMESLQAASTKEAIPESNRGFQMLQRMGWKGQGLGSKEDGIVEPVGGGAEAGVRLGLGKQEEDDFYTAADNVQRKRLEVELQAEEDATRTARREELAERQQRIKQDVSDIMRTFYCEVCHKQYKSAAQLEEHLSSYDHHHRKRLVEMRSAEHERTRKERGRRERRRQEREAARLNEQIQRAHGIPPAGSAEPPLPQGQQPPPPPPPPPLPDDAPPPPPLPAAAAPTAAAEPAAGFGGMAFNTQPPAPAKAAAPVSLRLGVRRPGIQKPVKLKSGVAAFGLDADDEG